MAAAGRGGSSDVGQRIRDEILAVQSRNNCKVSFYNYTLAVQNKVKYACFN